MLYSCTRMATVGVKGLICALTVNARPADRQVVYLHSDVVSTANERNVVVATVVEAPIAAVFTGDLHDRLRLSTAHVILYHQQSVDLPHTLHLLTHFNDHPDSTLVHTCLSIDSVGIDLLKRTWGRGVSCRNV